MQLLSHDDHHLGLSHDLETMTRAILRRRQALLWLAGSAAVPLFACGGGGDSTTSSTTGSTTGSTTTTTTTGGTTTIGGSTTTCAVTPEETAGPFPADGSNSNGSGTTSVSTPSGIVRSDTTPSQNYLRGVQETDANGDVTFTTIFPACYSGRMPHIHFEVYRSLSTATSYSSKLRTGQLAFPVDVCNTFYAST